MTKRRRGRKTDTQHDAKERNEKRTKPAFADDEEQPEQAEIVAQM